MSKDDIIKIILTAIISAIPTYFITNYQIEKSRELAEFQLEQSRQITFMQLEETHKNWIKENSISIGQKKQEAQSSSIRQLSEIAYELNGLRNQYYSNRFSMLMRNARLDAYPNMPDVKEDHRKYVEFFNKTDTDINEKINSKKATFLSLLNTLKSNYTDDNVNTTLILDIANQLSSNFLPYIDDKDIALFYIAHINSLNDDRKAWEQTWEEYYRRSQNDYKFPYLVDLLMVNVNQQVSAKKNREN